MANFLLPIVALAVVVVLLLPSVRNAILWRATVTPLASIIGSGFLISGPLLTHIAGSLAPVAMLMVLLAAYRIGAVIRFNIKYAEPLLVNLAPTSVIAIAQKISDLALGFAYVVSVAFYIRLLAAFLMRFSDGREPILESALTTVVLLFIATVGWLRGLGGLEKLEETAVAIKLAIIAALVIGLIGFDIQWLSRGEGLVNIDLKISVGDRFRLLAGLLLIVQGFETSRYLGKGYDGSIRIRSMQLAQIISTAIYMLFVVLGLPLLMEFHGAADETIIIVLAGRVAAVMSVLLLVAAVMSQFSAAVADTVGAGGLFNELSGNRISDKVGYTFLIVVAIVLVWTANVFEIVTLASRVFAIYYLLQCLVAIAACSNYRKGSISYYHWRIAAYISTALVLILVIVFAKPVG